jgi:hypothetical protein
VTPGMVAVPTDFVIPGFRALPAVWVYDPAAPLVVRLCLRPETCAEEWVFARDLLVDAFTRVAGEGDVILTVRGPEILVSLSSPDGHVLLSGDSGVAASFLHRAFQACPVGAEGAVVDSALDRALEQIVREAAS